MRRDGKRLCVFREELQTLRCCEEHWTVMHALVTAS